MVVFFILCLVWNFLAFPKFYIFKQVFYYLRLPYHQSRVNAYTYGLTSNYLLNPEW